MRRDVPAVGAGPSVVGKAAFAAMWRAMLGWNGVDQDDEANAVGQQFLDDFELAYRRRPEWVVP